MGRGLQDFKSLTWDASHRDATPTESAPFDQGVVEYRLPRDLMGNSRKKGSVVVGAVTRSFLRLSRALLSMTRPASCRAFVPID